MIIKNSLLNMLRLQKRKLKMSSSGDVPAALYYDTGRDIVSDAAGHAAGKLTAGREKGEITDAPQLTEIAPKILHSKGCFKAFCETKMKMCGIGSRLRFYKLTVVI